MLACAPENRRRSIAPSICCVRRRDCFFYPLCFVGIALAIKFDDGGPVFYRQVRMGRNFRRFRVFKFRSMVPGADRDGLLTAPGDPRLTRVGRWLRRYKLDELPQLFNVSEWRHATGGCPPRSGTICSNVSPPVCGDLAGAPGHHGSRKSGLSARRSDALSPHEWNSNMWRKFFRPSSSSRWIIKKQRSLLSDVRILLRTRRRITRLDSAIPSISASRFQAISRPNENHHISQKLFCARTRGSSARFRPC